MTDIKRQLREDARKANTFARITYASLGYYAVAAYRAVRTPLITLGFATLVASCGSNSLYGLSQNNGKSQTEKVSKKSGGFEYVNPEEKGIEVFGGSNERLDEERIQESHDRFLDEHFASSQGDAGLSADYGTVGEGASSSRDRKQLEEGLAKAYEGYGTGLSHEDLDEIDKSLQTNKTTLNLAQIKSSREGR